VTQSASKPGDPDYISVEEATRRALEFNAKTSALPGNVAYEQLTAFREQNKQRKKLADKGTPEAYGPPNPYRPHRKF
jgi:hypothetical protein